MKSYHVGILWIIGLLMISTTGLEARPGSSGRNFGSRGSRGFSAPSPYRPAPRYVPPSQPYRSAPLPPSYPPQAAGGRGSFLRGLAGGVAGGFLGSMLFRGLGGSSAYGYGGGGGGGLGLLEIFLLCGLGFLAYRWYRSRNQVPRPVSYAAVDAPIGGESASPYEAAPADDSFGDADPIAVLRRYDGAFDLSRFQQERVDDFFRVQRAYSSRDLGGIQDRLTPELYWQLEQESSRLRSQGRQNRVENVQVANSEVVEAWQETGREYATLRVRASALDYVVDEKSGELISGNKDHPSAFEEYWTFVRDIGFAASDKRWKLAAIENSAHPA